MKQKINEYINSREAAEFIGVHQNTLKNWAKKGKLTFYNHPLNSKWYMFKKADLEELLSKIKAGQPK